MIRFGPAGIPLSNKGRTLEDGIRDVHNLSLGALEVQMVRSNTYSRPPEDEEIGMTLKDIEEGFVVEIMRDGEPINDVDEPIDEDDELMWMPSGITDTFGDLYGLGEMSRRLDVKMSIHTPYYMDLGRDMGAENAELTYECFDSLRHAAVILDAMDGDVVVTNLGLYDGKVDREEVDGNIMANVENLMDWWNGYGLKPKLGIEITGHQDVFGSLDQVLDLCDAVENTVPVLNFSHYHSRTCGSLLEKENFIDVIDQVMPYSDGRLYSAFAGVDYDQNGNERRLTPIKRGDLKFDPLAEALIDLTPEATIISTSPLLEHDAMYMRIIHERALAKKVAKDMKERRKAEAAMAAGE